MPLESAQIQLFVLFNFAKRQKPFVFPRKYEYVPSAASATDVVKTA